MSEVQQELEMESPASAEDRFFGVKQLLAKKERLVRKNQTQRFLMLSMRLLTIGRRKIADRQSLHLRKSVMMS